MSNPRLPKKLYFVTVAEGEGEPIWLYEKRGGKYTIRAHALACARTHLHKGRQAKVWETETAWREVPIA